MSCPVLGPPTPGHGLSLLRMGALSLPQKMSSISWGKKGQGSEINRGGWASCKEEGQKRTEQPREEGRAPPRGRWREREALRWGCQVPALKHCSEKARIFLKINLGEGGALKLFYLEVILGSPKSCKDNTTFLCALSQFQVNTLHTLGDLSKLRHEHGCYHELNHGLMQIPLSFPTMLFLSWDWSRILHAFMCLLQSATACFIFPRLFLPVLRYLIECPSTWFT